MTKGKKPQKEDRGLRTFLLYGLIVTVVIVVSLCIKAFFVFQENKFDGKNLNLLISHNNRVVALAGFNTQTSSIAYLKITDSLITTDLAAGNLGIIYDAKINSPTDLSKESLTTILAKSALKQGSIITDLTIFDVAQLLYLSKTISGNKTKIEEIKRREDRSGLEMAIKDLFKNDNITSENISIQIVNAAGEAGLGNRLERSLSNIGANVVAVSTSRSRESHSKIKYFGEESYTLKKMQRVLKYPLENLKEKSIADIIIVIGEDSKDKLVF